MSNFKKPKGVIGGLLCGLMNLGHGPMIREVLAAIDIQPREVVLDIGCGGGLALAKMSEKCAKAYGIDYSEVSVARARQKNRAAVKAGRVEVSLADVAEMSFPDQSLDLVTAFETIYFWNDLPGCLRRIHQMLKPGGRLAIAVEAWKEGEDKVNCPGLFDCLNLKLYNQSELTGLLSEAGFRRPEFFRGQKRKWFLALARKEPRAEAPPGQ